jgi:DNA polymerase III subunit epsilon
MADRLFALVERRGRPVEVRDAVSRILRLQVCPESLGRAVARQLVDGDARLAWHGPDHVGLAQRTSPGLDETGFCVIDLETTGGSPGRSKITEIAAVRVRGFSCGETFSTLVDPGHPIPPVITAITSIDDAMVAGQPDIAEALPMLLDFCGDDVLVAHNAPFDLRFLNYERRRLLGSYFTQPWVDTLVLARRLLNGEVARHDLATLAAWAGTSTRPRHRALADAEATAEVLIRFLRILDERGDGSPDRVIAVGQWGAGRYVHKQALAEGLPSSPGVYLMRDEAGTVLYVGKASNLRRRVRGYFGTGERHGRRLLRALEGLDRIDHEVCGSAFEAEWRESRLLREHQPPCNGQSADTGQYIKLTVNEPYPRLLAVERPAAGALCVGPVRSARTVRRALAALHRLYPLRSCRWVCRPGAEAGAVWCEGPCHGTGEGYAGVVAEVSNLLTSDTSVAMALVAPRLERAMREGRIASEGEMAEDTAALLSVLASLGRTRRALSESGVLLEPSSLPGCVTAFFVACGHVIHRDDVSVSAWHPAAVNGLDRISEAARTMGGLITTGALPEVLIVTDRIASRRSTPAFIPVEPTVGRDAVLASVHAGIAWVNHTESLRLSREEMESASSAA